LGMHIGGHLLFWTLCAFDQACLRRSFVRTKCDKGDREKEKKNNERATVRDLKRLDKHTKTK